jgi:glutathione synthase
MLRIATQMDPIARTDIRGDSTFALLLEAQRRGHALFYYTPDALTYREGTLTATGHDLAVRDTAGDFFTLSPPRTENLSTQNVVLLRQDPPFDMAYITNTHLLQLIHPKTLVVNDPVHVRNAPEKLWILEFADLMPPTLISRVPADIMAFRREYQDIIVKPLFGNGGAGVFRITAEDTNLASLLEMPEVRAGDKRIILVDGVVAGAINRVPAVGETRSNMHVGGRPEPTTLTKREHEICERLGPELKRRGLIFVGIDVIGDYLTEINVTSPTGIRQVKAFGGTDIAALIWDAIEAKAGAGAIA